jgi:hypothetical protein
MNGLTHKWQDAAGVLDDQQVALKMLAIDVPNPSAPELELNRALTAADPLFRTWRQNINDLFAFLRLHLIKCQFDDSTKISLRMLD